MSNAPLTDWLPEARDPDLVSVIVPTFNRRSLLIELLDSLAAQTWRPLEVIVVDDGSTDGTAGAVQHWPGRHPGLTVTLLEQPNAGPASARNRGLAVSRGGFIYFIDSDDLVFPMALEQMVGSIRTSGRSYCLAQIETFDSARGDRFAEPDGRPRQAPGNVLFCRWWTHAALYTRDAVARAGPYTEGLRGGEDSEFHWRIAATNGLGREINAAVGVRRRHSHGHLSLGRSKAEEIDDCVANLRAYCEWARPGGRLSPADRRQVAWLCFGFGIDLGLLGAWDAADRAFATMAWTGWCGKLLVPIAYPRNRRHFGMLRAAIRRARQAREPLRNFAPRWLGASTSLTVHPKA